MPTVNWYTNAGGSRGAQGLDFYISGESIPATATITSVKLCVCLSVNSPAGSYTQLYYLRDQTSPYYYFCGGSSQEYGAGGSYIARQYTTDFSNHYYYDGDDGIEYYLDNYLWYFAGRSDAYLNIRVNNSGSGTSYVRGIDLYITYTDNSAPGLVSSINYPSYNGAITYNLQPNFSATLGSDPDGDLLQLGWAIYDSTTGSWPVATQWIDTWYTGGSNVSWFCTELLTRGHSYILYCYQRDTNYQIAASGSASRSFTVGTPVSAVSAGAKFDDATIDTAQTNLENLRKYYYGSSATNNFTTCNYGIIALDDHIDELDAAVWDTPYGGAITDIDPGAKITAAHFNTIRYEIMWETYGSNG